MDTNKPTSGENLPLGPDDFEDLLKWIIEQFPGESEAKLERFLKECLGLFDKSDDILACIDQKLKEELKKKRTSKPKKPGRSDP